jgi:rod shape-determining protein MreC
MESFFSRYRNLLVLLVVLLAQIIGLAVQVRHTDSGRNTIDSRDPAGVRLIRLWADAVVTPPEHIFHASKLGSVSLWQNYIDLRHTREQNQELQKTIDRLRLEQASLMEDARQGERLQALLDFQQRYIYKTVAAQAIGSSGNDSSRVFYIDKGWKDGVVPDMAVITPDGIVGKVRESGDHTAQVLAINDPTSGAGVILETTRHPARRCCRPAADCGHPGRPAHPAGRKGAHRRGRHGLPARVARGRGGARKAGSRPRFVHRRTRESGSPSRPARRGAGDYFHGDALFR